MSRYIIIIIYEVPTAAFFVLMGLRARARRADEQEVVCQPHLEKHLKVLSPYSRDEWTKKCINNDNLRKKRKGLQNR